MKRILTVIIITGVLIILNCFSIYAYSNDYIDISNNWAREYIKDLIDMGKVDGYGDNTICPDNLITRAEFSKILVEAMDIDFGLEDNLTYFKDVKQSDWHYKYISFLKQKKIIDGYDDGNFRPNRNISRSEMLAMVVRISMNNLKISKPISLYNDVKYDYWGYRDISIASRAGIILENGEYLNPNEFVTRSEVFYTIDKMLWNQKGSTDSPQNIFDLIIEYNNQLDYKFSNTDSNFDQIYKYSFGGNLKQMQDISAQIALYDRLNIGIKRSTQLSNPVVVSQSKNLAKVTFNYNLIEKLDFKTGIRSNNKEGVMSYYLKMTDGKWQVYRTEFTDIKELIEKGDINLVWDYIGNGNIDSFRGGKVNGLNILSPTWFSLYDNNGNINSFANAEYVRWVHNNGYQVWALINNDFDMDLTSQVMQNANATNNLINQIVKYVDEYNIDGINVDFENMKIDDKNLFTEFVRKLSVPLKERDVILSVDVTVITPNSNWSSCYDRRALAEIVDYVAVMTYDQHWATSPISGSVAQVTWVEDELKEILNEVPNEKLLLGIPFYTRLWVESNDKVTSQAISMEESERLIKENVAQKIWDSQSGQYYAEYKKEGKTYKIWVEDATSIGLKVKLINKYNLAGVASWRAGFETQDIWDAIDNNLN